LASFEPESEGGGAVVFAFGVGWFELAAGELADFSLDTGAAGLASPVAAGPGVATF
jgi:hypothetical protein